MPPGNADNARVESMPVDEEKESLIPKEETVTAPLETIQPKNNQRKLYNYP